jgi:hypothetical protein
MLAFIFGIKWFTFHCFLATQIPEEFGMMGKILYVYFTISIFIGIGFILKNEKK